MEETKRKKLLKKLEEKDAITLIALIITIIVLIILSGVTISTIAGENGIIRNALSSKENTKISNLIDQIRMEILEKNVENLGRDITIEEFREILEKYYDDVPNPLPDDILDKTLKTKSEYGNYDILIRDIYDGKFSNSSLPPSLVDNILFIKKPDDWTNEEVNVILQPKIDISNYTLQYSTDGENWEDYNEKEGITVTENNTTVYAKLVKGSMSSEWVQDTVTNIDKNKPGQPNIEVIKATNGDNGYYKSDVELKITEGYDEQSGVQKTTYELGGATIQGEKEIENQGTITIKEEGETTVTVYTYDNVNNKSEPKIIIVKKDTNAPIINLEQVNTTTKEYKKNINANITDSTSKVKVKKYAYKERDNLYFNDKGTTFEDSFVADFQGAKEEITGGNNNGPQFVYTVYAKDDAGNETTKTITIKNLLIDAEITGNSGLAIGGSENTKDAATGRLIIKGKGGQYGPYWHLPAGTYEVTYKGTNLPLKDSAYYCNSLYNSTGNNIPFTRTIQTLTSTSAVYTFVVPNEIDNVELHLEVGDISDTVYVDSVRIRQIN